MNRFTVKPELEPLIEPSEWTDPITGLIVPKDPTENLQYRVKLLEACDEDTDFRRDVYTACSESVLFFVNSMCWTLRVFEPGEAGKLQQAVNPHLPFVTWQSYQDEHILRIEDAIENGTSLLTDKSRDMGATWDHLIVLLHRFLFRPDETFLLISRKENVVDLLDGLPKNYPYGPVADPGTLMGKLDYCLSRLPEWMVPRMNRKKLHLTNMDSKARIDGESANATAGTSDRRTALFLDEFAKVEEAESIKRSTADVTACRLVCSTPNGAGTVFSAWRMSGQIPVMECPWWKHPEKGKDRYTDTDDLGRFQIRSPWYDIQCKERSPKEIATELDFEHVLSGDMFFDSADLEKHRNKFARPPRRKGAVRFQTKLSDAGIVAAVTRCDASLISFEHGTGPWRFWIELVKGRPDQTKTYTISVDISKGQGASNSVINIGCDDTKEKVAEFADANTPPHELAKLAVAAALWCGGKTKRPLIIWENNGDAGFDFGRQLVHVLRYPSVFFDRAVGTTRQRIGKRYGWRSNTEKKAEALGLLRRAYALDSFVNHSDESITEAASYVSYEGGGIGPAGLTHESDSARKAHGDRVIADMLLCWAWQWAIGARKKDDATRNPASIGGRMKAFVTAKKERQKTPRIGQEITIG